MKRAILHTSAVYPDAVDAYAASFGKTIPVDREVTAGNPKDALLAAIRTNSRPDISSWLYVSGELWDVLNDPEVVAAAQDVEMTLCADDRLPRHQMLMAEISEQFEYVILWHEGAAAHRSSHGR